MEPSIQRRAITVCGLVQGVGFRPFVHSLATRLSLAGFVRNRPGSVQIEVEGTGHALDQFQAELISHAPPLALIHRLDAAALTPRDEHHFQIETSDASGGQSVVISPDVATCGECLAELFSPTDRRYRYPFLNCTHCGPRLTIVLGTPYDRERTTMTRFAMCPECRREYDDPQDRRFHAQPIACSVCGPQLELRSAAGESIWTNDPLGEFARRILAGEIGALKGVGGFHLACDARSEEAVLELRRRKHRDARPLAVMVHDVTAAERLCHVSVDERALLQSPAAPIVLLRRRADGAICRAVAPGNPNLGLLLPYSPLHHLLLAAVGDVPLVMTSGNQAEEPIATENDEARLRLAGIADVLLMHDRPIHVRCDDSVTRIAAGCELPLRRSRGYAPLPIPLCLPCPVPLLAVGGQLKGVFALAKCDHAVLSHHLGDLDHLPAREALAGDITLYEELFQITPEMIVHDEHPDYATTRYAQDRAAQDGIRPFPVQHHHAHIASCLAEHGLDEPVIGVAFDGAGWGLDETTGQPTVWGGEFLVGYIARMRRAAHFRNVGMPGGERAVREAWRMAAAHLLDAGCSL